MILKVVVLIVRQNIKVYLCAWVKIEIIIEKTCLLNGKPLLVYVLTAVYTLFYAR